jgi:hypothetical protein
MFSVKRTLAINVRITFQWLHFSAHWNYCRECKHLRRKGLLKWNDGFSIHLNVITPLNVAPPYCFICNALAMSLEERQATAMIMPGEIAVTELNYPTQIDHYHMECFEKKTNMPLEHSKHLKDLLERQTINTFVSYRFNQFNGRYAAHFGFI